MIECSICIIVLIVIHWIDEAKPFYNKSFEFNFQYNHDNDLSKNFYTMQQFEPKTIVKPSYLKVTIRQNHYLELGDTIKIVYTRKHRVVIAKIVGFNNREPNFTELESLQIKLIEDSTNNGITWHRDAAIIINCANIQMLEVIAKDKQVS